MQKARCYTVYQKITRVKSVNKLLVICYGNLSRGDDALGPLAAEYIEQLCEQMHWQHITIITAYQLQIEQVIDIEQHATTLFVDADIACKSPFQITPCQAETGQPYTSHALSPNALLSVFQRSYNKTPPPCYLLSIRGESFQLGQSLSAQASQNLHLAKDYLKTLCERASITLLANNKFAQVYN